jgi:hypothetical protein
MIHGKKYVVAFALLLGWSVLAPCRGMAQNSTALGWRPWEQELISNVDYTASNGNPYRDLALTVEYWRRPGPQVCGAPIMSTDQASYFKGFGFWEGGKKNASGVWEPNGKRFLIRSTFPDGIWCWKTKCMRSPPDASASSTQDCMGDSGLERSGQVAVTKAASPVRLYALGLPKVTTDRRSLVFGDLATKFIWLGETAWDAPINYGDGTQWAGFVTDRTAPAKDFRTVLVAPATQTVSAVPAGGFKGFGAARNDCSAAEKTVVPNRCSTWDAKYWEQFDALVLKANATSKGLMVIVAGVMDPLVRGGDNNGLNLQFPRVVEAQVFARNLAARLAGYFVFFSPSYDTKTVVSTVNRSADGSTVTVLVKAVGTAIKSAAPRHLIGVHLAGSNPLAAYLNFAGDSWLDFQMFQSGHGGSNSGSCNFSIDFERSVCRAREGPLEFLCIHEAPPPGAPYTPLAVCTNGNSADRIGTPKPAVNVEGEYESAYVKTTQSDGTIVWVRSLAELTPSRARSRHTAWTSALSGSFGFNIGLFRDVVAWTNPPAYSNGYMEAGQTNLFQSDDDLGRMSLLLGQSPWSQFVPAHTLVCGNFPPPAGTTSDPCGTPNPIRSEELKRHIGVTPKVILVHVPGVSSSQQPIVKLLNQGLLASLSCGGWTATWMDPRGVGTTLSVPAQCAAVPNGLQYSVLPPASHSPQLSCPANQQTCDWILQLQSKTLASANAPTASGLFTEASSPVRSLSSTDNDLKVWTEVDPDSQGNSVWAQLLDANGDPLGDSFLVHPPDPRVRSLPTATRDSLGNFLVVWEEEGDDATDDVVAVQMSNSGVSLGPLLRVNGSTEAQNGDPAVTSDSAGYSYVTWTEYPLDGSLGNIWLQVFGPSGSPAGDVLMVTNDPGNQFASQVQADGSGGVMVAWTSDPPPADTTLAANTTLAKAKPRAGQGVYFRKLHRDGKPLGPAHAVHGNGKGRDRLVDLKVKANGKLRIVWNTINDEGELEGIYEQDFDSEGNPASAAKRLRGEA